jgi:hypothetical protein
VALVESGLREHGFKRCFQSLRENFRPEEERVDIAPGQKGTALERWMAASMLGDENTAARVAATKAQAVVSTPVDIPESDPEAIDSTELYAREVSALRAEVAALSSRRKRRRYRRHD